MSLKHLAAAVPAILALASDPVDAGATIDEAGVIVCVNDKWEVQELAKRHKLVDYAGRCVKVPDDKATAKSTEACTGRYEYLPDGSWKAAGTCTATQKAGDTVTITWEEGSHLTENPYKANSGTGKFKGVVGGGTYKYDQLTETLFGGRYHSKWQLP